MCSDFRLALRVGGQETGNPIGVITSMLKCSSPPSAAPSTATAKAGSGQARTGTTAISAIQNGQKCVQVRCGMIENRLPNHGASAGFVGLQIVVPFGAFGGKGALR